MLQLMPLACIYVSIQRIHIHRTLKACSMLCKALQIFHIERIQQYIATQLFFLKNNIIN